MPQQVKQTLVLKTFSCRLLLISPSVALMGQDQGWTVSLFCFQSPLPKQNKTETGDLRALDSAMWPEDMRAKTKSQLQLSNQDGSTLRKSSGSEQQDPSTPTDSNVLNPFALKACPARQSPDPDRQENRDRGGWPQDYAGSTQAWHNQILSR